MFTVRAILCLLISVVTSEVSIDQSNGYVSIEEYPFVVSVRIRGHHVCGGAIIDYSWVLTAAHCFSNSGIRNPREVQVLAGTIDINGIGGSLYSVEQMYIHENFTHMTQNLQGDISLLKLSQPFQYSGNINYIKIGRLYYDNTKVIALGWGAESEGGPMSTVLKSVEMSTIQQDSVCREDDSHICALAPAGWGTCTGDSGGPLIDAYSKKLVGLRSMGERMCGLELASTFTKVYPYWNWINYVKKLK